MERLLELVLSLAIVGSALAFGGVQPLTYSLVEAAIFLAVFFLLLKQTRDGKVVFPLPLWPVLFALLVVFQVIPLPSRSEEHTSELQSRLHLVCRLLLEKKNNNHPTLPGLCAGVSSALT